MDYLITDLKDYMATALLGATAYKAVTWLVVLLSSLVFVISDQKWRKKAAMFFLGIYLYFVFSTTVIIRPETSGSHLQSIPFWSYAEVLKDIHSSMKYDIIENVLLFLPAGAAVGYLNRSKQRLLLTTAYFCFFSITIELMQYFLRVGLCEFDDVFHNTLGALIGYGIAAWFCKFGKRKEFSDD